MCHSSPIKTLNENVISMSARSNSDRNNCKKSTPTKLQDSENTLPQKLRKMDSSDTQLSGQRSGISGVSHHKSYESQERQDSDLKVGQGQPPNGIDRKTSTGNNLQQNRHAKDEGGKYINKSNFSFLKL